MSYPVYYVEADDTLPILFDTFAGGTGASITMSGLATSDIEIYKDGSATQRSSDAGYTLLDTDGIDFDGITGIHGFSIDLSDNTDAGFFVVGSWYHVVVSTITVDGQTVSFIAAAFRIVSATRGMAGTALPDAAADAAGGLPISDAGGLDLDTQIGTDIDAILADTNELQSDDVPGLIAALNDLSAAQVNAEVDTALSDIHLDHLLAADYDPASKPGTATALLNELIEDDGGVSRFTANALEEGPVGGSAPTAAQVADAVWDEAQADHVSAGSFGEMATELAAVLADTNELQTDDVPGLIAALNDLDAAGVRSAVGLASANLDSQLSTIDTVADGIKAVTDNLPDAGALNDLAAILADTGTDGVAIATATAQAIADEILKRGISNVEDSADTTSLAALVLAAFESAISGTTWTIKKTDGVTTFDTKTVTTDSGADPITGVS